MQSFISETIDAILKTTKSFENVVFILPSQRAGIFVKQQLKDKIFAGFLPEIINIGHLVEAISEMKKADAVQMLFHFYTIYKKNEPQADNFAKFSSWAFTVIQDFNEIDQHLIDTKAIFSYLKDLHRLEKWSVDKNIEETELVKDHFAFIEKLNVLYDALYEFLKDNNIGYQGVLYREATKKTSQYLAKHPDKKYFFIGFNALNAAEEFIFQAFLEAGNTKVFWDIDQSFYESNHQAGSFLRKYKTTWAYYQNHEIESIANNFASPKNIQVIGAAKNITQVKYAGELLSKFNNFNNTALVLADESLLPTTLNSLPNHVNAINITMGYPLRDMPTTSLLMAVFQLFINQERLQKQEQNAFYHKDVVRFLKHPLIHQLLLVEENSIANTIAENIVKDNITFVSKEQLAPLLNLVSPEIKDIILAIFSSFEGVSNFLQRIVNLIEYLKDSVNELEKEYLFRFYTAFTQLQNLHTEFSYIQDLKTLQQFFRQLIQSESLSFQGEPLQGLQLMGVLETRVLDFENVIITSVNEGILPANHQQNSFIPFDVKVAFKLPTYKEKDALFSYHFFRLLQRAKNVFIIYNTEHDVFGSGEKSRFVTQLQMMRDDVLEKNIAPQIITESKTLKVVEKNELVFERLKELAEKGISPSVITNYLYNPIAFYKQKVLKIKEFQEVEETVAVNTMGTVVHDTLEQLYIPYTGKFLQPTDIRDMQQKTKELIIYFFSKHFKNGNISTGKNRLVFEVANRFVKNFLAQEKELVSNPKNQLKIIATEQELSTIIEIEGIPYPVKIKGIVDRIDELNGVTRIIDYKTGKVDKSNLKTPDFSTITEMKYHKAIQVMLYAYLYTKQKVVKGSTNIEAGIISFKNLKSGFLKMDFDKGRKGNYEITTERLEEFMEEIKTVIKEIYDKNVPFEEPVDLPY